MATHNDSMTCVAGASISIYSIVELAPEVSQTSDLPVIKMCNSSSDVIFGVAMATAEEGDLITVRFPFSGMLPAYVYASGGATEIKPGDGLTIGVTYDGSLSNNPGAAYARKVAYIVQTKPWTGSGTEWAAVMFVRSYFE